MKSTTRIYKYLTIWVVLFFLSSAHAQQLVGDCHCEMDNLSDVTYKNISDYGLTNEMKNVLLGLARSKKIKILLEANSKLDALDWINSNTFAPLKETESTFLFIRSDKSELANNESTEKYNGVISIHPGLPETRSGVNVAIESINWEGRTHTLENIIPLVSKYYADYLFNVLLPRGYYVYPLKGFENEAWYPTYIGVLVQNKVERNWEINDTEGGIYPVKNQYGQILHKGFLLHGIYDVNGINQFSTELKGIINTQMNSVYKSGFSFLYKNAQDVNPDRNNWYKSGIRMGPWANTLVFSERGKIYLIKKDGFKKQKTYYDCLNSKLWEELYPSSIYRHSIRNGAREDQSNENPSPNSISINNYTWHTQSKYGNGKPTIEQQNYLINSDEEDSYLRNGYNTHAYNVEIIYNENDCKNIMNKYETFKDLNGAEPVDHFNYQSNEVGFYPYHYKRFANMAKEFQMIVGIRNSNPSATKWISAMYQGGPYRPKPFLIKSKSIQNKTFKVIDYTNQNYLNYGVENNTSRKLIGPGYVTTDDTDHSICDVCADLGGLASLDPRTKRGRDLYDPYQELGEGQSCGDKAELDYANTLIKKLFKKEDPIYYVYPIPFFANKYVEPINLANIRINLANIDIVMSSYNRKLGIFIKDAYMDHFNRDIVVEIRKSSGNNFENIAEVLTYLTDIESNNAKMETVKVIGIVEENNQFDYVFERTLLNINPTSSTYATAYRATKECGSDGIFETCPVWLNEQDAAISGINIVSSNYLKFVDTDLYKTLKENNLIDDISLSVNWVQGYYGILKNLSKNENLGKLKFHRCYIVKDKLGNAFYSDYDAHSYNWSNYHENMAKRGESWFPLVEVQDARKYYELIGLYSMLEFKFPQADPLWAVGAASIANSYRKAYISKDVVKSIADPRSVSSPSLNLDNIVPYSLIQHGPQDAWNYRNYFAEAGVNAGPQSNLTIWAHNKNNNVNVYTIGEEFAIDQEKLYKCLGINWKSIYPSQYYNKASETIHHSNNYEYSTKILNPSGQFNIYWYDIKTNKQKVLWNGAKNLNISDKQYMLMINELIKSPTISVQNAINNTSPTEPTPAPLPCSIPNQRIKVLSDNISIKSDTIFGSVGKMLWPNPASTRIYVQFISNSIENVNYTISLSEINGKILDSKTITNIQNSAYFDTQNLSDGIYFIRWYDHDSGKFEHFKACVIK